MFKPITYGLLATVLLAGTPALVAADPKPQNAKPADPQTIANAFAGKTFKWKTCKGGIYYGANWQAQAYCNREGPAVGIGTWSVDANARICHALTWYWFEGDEVGSKSEPVTDRNCEEHLVDPSGRIWRSWGGETEWWDFPSSYMKKGFLLKSKVTRLRKKLGV